MEVYIYEEKQEERIKATSKRMAKDIYRQIMADASPAEQMYYLGCFGTDAPSADNIILQMEREILGNNHQETPLQMISRAWAVMEVIAKKMVCRWLLFEVKCRPHLMLLGQTKLMHRQFFGRRFFLMKKSRALNIFSLDFVTFSEKSREVKMRCKSGVNNLDKNVCGMIV